MEMVTTLYNLKNERYSLDEIKLMNKWHKSVYGYQINDVGIEMEKLLRAKDLGKQ